MGIKVVLYVEINYRNDNHEHNRHMLGRVYKST